MEELLNDTRLLKKFKKGKITDEEFEKGLLTSAKRTVQLTDLGVSEPQVKVTSLALHSCSCYLESCLFRLGEPEGLHTRDYETTRISQKCVLLFECK